MLYPISVPKPNSAEDLIGYIDHSGRVVVKPTYAAGAYFSETLAAVCRGDGLSGFIDVDGETRIPFRYHGLGLFHEGLCPIGQGSAVGYLHRSGRWQIKPRFAVAGRFSEGLAKVSLDGSSFGYVDRVGTFVVKPLYEQVGVFSNGLGAASQEGKWGYVGRDGSVIIPFQFQGPRAQVFTNGRAGVSIGGRWGFIDAGGNWVVMPQYEDVRRFNEGFAPVRHSEKWGVIDAAGRIRTTPRFDELGEFDQGMAAASSAGRAGFVSPEGEWVIEPNFDKCYRFVGALAMVRIGDRYSYLSQSGVVVWTSEPHAMPQAPPFKE
jgi:WG containing repeat